ncbi:phage protease [Segnochrobactrum spirostomi]|uniref:Mu-like prophage I protein n=1 Tax=Segnochrobactrum spirostomi TaxID=2608987 RepID=A0A6A7Y6R7_9HYPH|nr:phage protease [Segnochrobactrum spirostomi]MQT14395.1 hypothetical protein [Segnochrobactrum spirostomi]
MEIALFSSLPADGNEVPAWVHLVPSGIFRGADGRGPYRLGDAEAVIHASMADGAKLPIDENHAFDLAAPKGLPAPARGWIVELQSRPNGIWGRVEWTPTGATLVAERAYRGLSPAIAVRTADRTIAAVLRASLTNDPNLPLTSLHSRSPLMDLDALRTALGLGADATEADVLAAIAAQRTAVSTHAATLSRIATAAGLADGVEPDAIVTTLQSRGASDVDKLRSTVVELQTQLTEIGNARARDVATRVVDDAIKSGRVGLHPLRDHYITRHMADPQAVEREIAAMPVLNSGGRVAPPAGDQASGGLSAEEAETCELMGISREKFIESRKALGLEVI